MIQLQLLRHGNGKNALRLAWIMAAALLASASGASQSAREPVTAVLGAMQIELQLLEQGLENPTDSIIEGIPFTLG